MPHISMSDCEWMDSEELQLSSSVDAEDCIFGLRSALPDMEVSMTDEGKKALGQSDGGDIAALKAKHEAEMTEAVELAVRKAKAETEAALASRIEEVERSNSEFRLSSAKSEVASFTSKLEHEGRATAAQFAEGKLGEILLHARLHCPDIKHEDGSSTSMFAAMQGLLEMNVGKSPVASNYGFSAEGGGNAPASGSEAKDRAEKVRAYAAEHNLSVSDALQKFASGRAK